MADRGVQSSRTSSMSPCPPPFLSLRRAGLLRRKPREIRRRGLRGGLGEKIERHALPRREFGCADIERHLRENFLARLPLGSMRYGGKQALEAGLRITMAAAFAAAASVRASPPQFESLAITLLLPRALGGIPRSVLRGAEFGFAGWCLAHGKLLLIQPRFAGLEKDYRSRTAIFCFPLRVGDLCSRCPTKCGLCLFPLAHCSKRKDKKGKQNAERPGS
jgi:hypothetical protein